MQSKIKVNLPEIVGGGYGEFWRSKHMYRVVKGSRSSKKSSTIALWYIASLMKEEYKDANLLVVRKVYRTMKDSVFAQLKWACNKLNVYDKWEFKESPIEMTYKPTGQKILFRGLDDPLKITSITLEKGFLCWLWVEEAYEITSEDDFDTLDESIRGLVPEPLFKQATLSFNPWNERHWLKARFFDNPNPDVLTMTTTYKCNEWLDETDLKKFEIMQRDNPRRYKVAGLGHWGIVEGCIYENWREEAFDIVDGEKKELQELDFLKGCRSINGLDFGYTLDPSALFIGFIDTKNKKIYVWDEMYEKGLTNQMIYQRVYEMGYIKEQITADSAEPKSIDELQQMGMNVRGARKGPDSVKNGIQFIQNYEIIVHPRCVNFITEISNYTWDEDRLGNRINKPIGDFNHLMDAMRYAVEKIVRGDNFQSWE